MNKAFAILNWNDTTTKRVLLLFWAWIIPVVVLVFLIVKLCDSPYSIFQLPTSVNWVYLVGAIVLLPVNIWLESFKWKYLISQWQPVTFYDCFKVIMAGKSLNSISPLGIGEAFAKYTQFDATDFEKSITGIFIARMTQMIPTLFFGTISVFFIVNAGFRKTDLLLNLLLVAIILFSISAMILAWNKKTKQWFSAYYSVLKSIESSTFSYVLLLSFLRYAVFSLQFVLIFIWLGIDLDLMILVQGVFWIFLIKSIVPNLSILGDLASRELSSFAFFSFYLTDLNVVTFANFCIWIINLIIPALLGLYYIKGLKIVSK